MVEFIVCLVACLFAAASLVGAIKFWMRVEEVSDRIDYLERDLHNLAASNAETSVRKITRRK